MNWHASRRTRQRSGTFRPRLELLENRHLPSYSIAPIAILGHPAPGPEGGTFTFDFESGRLNNQGHMLVEVTGWGMLAMTRRRVRRTISRYGLRADRGMVRAPRGKGERRMIRPSSPVG
jgi:hypothetical protein